MSQWAAAEAEDANLIFLSFLKLDRTGVAPRLVMSQGVNVRPSPTCRSLGDDPHVTRVSDESSQ